MESAQEFRRARSGRRERPGRAVRIHERLDQITEIMICVVLIFTPWCFGTTERWAIKTVNTWNYLLGGILLAKWLARWTGGYDPARWGGEKGSRWAGRIVTGGLAIMTVAILGYCATSAWNARADFHSGVGFTYFENYRSWLPHSYAQSASWARLSMYLGAACFFWSLRDWLLTKEKDEEEVSGSATIVGPEDRVESLRFQKRGVKYPQRLKRLLWVITLNGALLAVEGTLQRLSGTEKLLWLVEPRFNNTAPAQFGPFNYRTNGAQYLNMIWPVSLALWWGLHQQRKTKLGEGAEFLLLPLTGLMLAAPIVATSRGGVAVAVGQALAVGAILAWGFRRSVWKAAAAIGILAALVGAGAILQWDFLRSRFNEPNIDTMGGRTVIYENARKIAEDFPVWGTGPGTFSAMYFMYRSDPAQPWFTHAHDDYLETLVTLGRVGLAGALTGLALALAHWPIGRGMPSSGLFICFLLTAMGGILLHAKWDFPFQIYSLLLLFLTLSAILTTTGRRAADAGGK